jgi:ATP-dependent Clp protease ATP-binding subunit ClpB
MNLDRYTNKAQEALLKANSLATDYGHGSIEPVHILHALVAQQEGVAPEVIAKIGGRPAALLSDLERMLDNLPHVSGSNVQIG